MAPFETTVPGDGGASDRNIAIDHYGGPSSAPQAETPAPDALSTDHYGGPASAPASGGPQTGDHETMTQDKLDDARDAFETAKDAASDRFEDIKDKAADGLENARHKAAEIKDKASDTFRDLRSQTKAGAAALTAGAQDAASDAALAARRAGDDLAARIERQPIGAVLAAAAVGYFIGWLAHSRR